MSQFSEDPPETLDEWNAILSNGCCCTMPECPVPQLECKSVEAYAYADGYFDADETEWKIYLKRSETADFSCSGSDINFTYTATAYEYYHYERDRNYLANVNGGSCGNVVSTVTESCDTGGSSTSNSYRIDNTDPENPVRGALFLTETTTRTNLTGTVIPDSDPEELYPVCSWKDVRVTDWVDDEEGEDGETTEYNTGMTTEYPGPTGTTCTLTTDIVYDFGKTLTEWFADVGGELATLLSGVGDECWTGSSCQSELVKYPTSEPANDTPASLTLNKSKYKWVIPDTFEGTYFKITWDVVFFPTTGDPSAVTTDATWEWTGPGDPEDEDSWKSGWYEIPVPTDAGENRVVNIRFECYRSAQFGQIPQITGEAVDIPPP